LLAGLRHQALPKVIDFFSDYEGQFLVMEYIPGADLAVLLEERKGPFPLADVLDWGTQLLRVVDYLHRQTPPVVHHDIKPQNLKLTDDHEIILLDLGMIKGENAVATRTVGRSLHSYTLTYAPPEQIQGLGTDAHSDLYSLSATLYHLLTNVSPPDALQRMSAVAQGHPDPLRPAHEVLPDVPFAVSKVLARGLALNPDDRPTGAAAMRAAWTDARHEVEAATTQVHVFSELPTAIEQQPSALMPPIRAQSIDYALVIWICLVMLLAIIGVVAWMFLGSVKP
jgi:serine/threonine protein kinase